MNYPVEKHYYETDDGYINMVVRISGKKGSNPIENTSSEVKKPVVILQHGLLDSSSCWIMNRENSLSFILAD